MAGQLLWHPGCSKALLGCRSAAGALLTLRRHPRPEIKAGEIKAGERLGGVGLGASITWCCRARQKGCHGKWHRIRAPWDPAASLPPHPADFTNDVGMRIRGCCRCCPASEISLAWAACPNFTVCPVPSAATDSPRPVHKWYKTSCVLHRNIYFIFVCKTSYVES